MLESIMYEGGRKDHSSRLLDGMRNRGRDSISIRVVALPSPKIGAHLIESLFCLPVQLPVGETRVRGQVGDITSTTVGHLVGQLGSDSLVEGLDHIKDRVAGAGSQVVGLAAKVSCSLLLIQLCQSCDVALCKIHNMKIIAIVDNKSEERVRIS